MKIVVYDPEILLWGIATEFHGYSVAFINKYADFIYVNWKSRSGLLRMLKYKKKMRELGINKKIRFTSDMKKINKCTEVMVGFLVPECTDGRDVGYYQGLKVFHLLDYYINPKKNNKFLIDNQVDYVMGHCQLDTYSELFRKYYPNYVNKVLNIPFGYSSRFKCIKSFMERKNKAVGLGSINPMLDPKLKDEATIAIREFFPCNKYMHETRKYLQDNANKYFDCIDALFPTPEQQKDFSYDAVEMLNNYTMFINDEGISNFPPARTFEGIACGSVMIATNNPIYIDLGFVPDVNYISFMKCDYEDMVKKIRYYMENPDLLLKIQEESLSLAKGYEHNIIADKIYQLIVEKGEKHY